MRFAVDAWAPEYGSPMGMDTLEPTTADVDCGIEVHPSQWKPLRPSGAAARKVRFVDGVRRVDARIWLDGGPQSRAAIAASYGAGVVCCDGAARIERAEIRRGLFSAVVDAEGIDTSAGFYQPHLAEADAADALVAALQQQMRALERTVAAAVDGADLVVVDGPLSRPAVAGAVGYVKTHQRSYLSAELSDVVGQLAAGERTPLFATRARETRFSWYLRLPTAGGSWQHPWVGIVRGEACGDVTVAEARRLADLTCTTLPLYASTPSKDPRAPQNLHPVAELERGLRRRLGDAKLLERALRTAAARNAA